MKKLDAFTGTGTMLRFMMRRDRFQIPVWIIAITAVNAATLAAFAGLYTTAAERQSSAATMANPAGIALTGPVFYLEDYTYGAMMSHQMLGMAAIAVALMSVFLIVRHTRKEEETGRAELIRASVTGRYASITAALLFSGGVNILLGLLVAVSMAVQEIASVGWEGSFLYGAALTSAGLVFTAVALLFVQLMEHSRSASGLSAGMVMTAYAVRAIGDIENETISWFSPIGWVQQTGAYVNNDWSPLLLSLFFFIMVTVAAFWLSVRRDMGAGMMRQGQGRGEASALLVRPAGLAFRLQRMNVVIWSLAMLLLGLAYGSFLGEAEAMLEGLGESVAGMLPEMDSGAVADSFAAMFLSVSAMIAAIPVVQGMLKLRGEEKDGRMEAMLSGAVSRIRLLGSYLVVAIGNSILFLFMSGLGMGISGSRSMENNAYFTDLIVASLAFAPAVWVAAAVTVLLFGIFPKRTAISWLVIVYAYFMVYFGTALQLPEWTVNLSPFSHVPRVPAEDLEWLPLLSLTAVAAVLVAIGMLGFRRRDIGL